MKRTSTVSLIFMSVFCSFTLGSSDFHLLKLSKNYTEAKTYCRELYTDLATIHNFEDMNNLTTLVSDTVNRAWIGLEIGNVWEWHWSLPEQKTDYFNWKPGHPLENNQDACAAMDQYGEWFESDCRTERQFVCHGSDANKNYTLVAEKKSWRDAQLHCRGLSSDLVSIQSSEENQALHNVLSSQDLWIGLFKDPWRWSDGSNSSFRFWKSSQPSYGDQGCVAAIFKDGGVWNDIKCSSIRNCICQGAIKPTPTSTLGTTTIEKMPTNPPTMTATNVNTQSISVTSDQNSTKPSASMPVIDNQRLCSENMILIQINLSWIEALSYCRKHHNGLVHITNQHSQYIAAEVAKNATSPYVWLGLRYTCEFKFWFWTKSTSGCYQNWVPGQGSERTYDCGVSGAIMATGGQQWVGLPETEKLNFICTDSDG
ncbi:C-type mannose receptor 2-like [Pholidichthys leucotaenia]